MPLLDELDQNEQKLVENIALIYEALKRTITTTQSETPLPLAASSNSHEHVSAKAQITKKLLSEIAESIKTHLDKYSDKLPLNVESIIRIAYRNKTVESACKKVCPMKLWNNLINKLYSGTLDGYKAPVRYPFDFLMGIHALYEWKWADLSKTEEKIQKSESTTEETEKIEEEEIEERKERLIIISTNCGCIMGTYYFATKCVQATCGNFFPPYSNIKIKIQQITSADSKNLSQYELATQWLAQLSQLEKECKMPLEEINSTYVAAALASTARAMEINGKTGALLHALLLRSLGEIYESFDRDSSAACYAEAYTCIKNVQSAGGIITAEDNNACGGKNIYETLRAFPCGKPRQEKIFGESSLSDSEHLSYFLKYLKTLRDNFSLRPIESPIFSSEENTEGPEDDLSSIPGNHP